MITTLRCAFSQWSPGLGDNTAMGWVTVLVYLLAAILSTQAARAMQGPEAKVRRERTFWRITAAVLFFLAVNKQLDLQTLFTTIGRCNARLMGWYDMRHTIQREFILAVGIAGVLTVGLLALLLRGLLGQVWPALLGIGFVCAFVLIRAASFHDVDGLIGSWAMGIKVNWLLELPGPILVALVAARRRRVVGPG
ncbi:isopropylmalate isomerase [Tabrizicola sp.]|jgi:hypothetical protein|uniref:isopropylmalate isomerase n=1 Tax=Tabrizicola sp. TaxID=2005166 RepID=UPI0035B448B6